MTTILSTAFAAESMVNFSARECPVLLGSGAYKHDAKADNVKADEELKAAIKNYGLVKTRHLFILSSLNEENSAMYVPEYFAFSQSTDGDREIEVIGWDDAYPKENFIESYPPPDNGAFRCLTTEGNELWISYYDISFNHDGAWVAVERLELRAEQQGGDLILSYEADGIHSYHLMATDSLMPIEWYDFGATNSLPGLQMIRIPIDRDASQRFFKLERLP